ncbi:MAG TPA: hypothetical protein DG753_13530 [Clostridium sp.]|nr:hypothetical protein [Clostridium sp.]
MKLNKKKVTVNKEIENSEKLNIKNIFNKFYIAYKSRNSGSTGLGLAIVKLLVKKIKGKVIAELNEDILIIKVFFND